MIRLLVLFIPSLLIACSKDQPAPVAPARKVSTGTLPFPANLRVQQITSTSARLLWSAVEGADDYDVVYKSLAEGKWKILTHVGTATTARLSGLAPNTKYRWTVKADRGQEKSRWAVGVNFTTLAATKVEPIPEPPSETPATPVVVEAEPFNIDLVFTDSFYQIGYTQEDIETIRYAASRWEELLIDIPDWTLPAGFSPMENVCGSSKKGPSSVDDLVLYIGALDAGWAALGLGGHLQSRGDWRTNSFGLAASGCIWIKPNLKGERLASIVAHEIGHVLGFGNTFLVPPPVGFAGTLAIENKYEMLFKGSKAVSEYKAGGGRGSGVPLTANGGHWRHPSATITLMAPYSNTRNPFEITTLDLAAIADLGYPVRMSKATPYKYKRR